MATTVANKNRKVRQDQLREQLANGGHVQHVIDIANQLTELSNTLEPVEVTRLTSAATIKLKLIDKYIPALKAVEHTGSLEVSDMTTETLNARIQELLSDGD